MERNIYQLLNKIEEDFGKKIKYLIENDVLTTNYIVKKAIETNDTSILFNVAFYIKSLTKEDIEKIAESIIQKKDMDKMCAYAAYIEGAPIEKIVNEIIEIGDAKYIFRLAVFIKDRTEYIDKLEKAISETKNAEYIYLFTKKLLQNLSHESINKLGNAISETTNLEYIYNFAKEIKDAPIYKLAYSIIKSKNKEYIDKLHKLENAPPDLNLMIERAKLEEMNEHEQLKQLNTLIALQENERIVYNADIYRRLFVDNNEELISLEEEIKQKKRVLTPQSGQGMRIEPDRRPLFPGIDLKQKSQKNW